MLAAGIAASATATTGRQQKQAAALYQGKPVTWWAHRTVQARKDANARAATIRRLRATIRRLLSARRPKPAPKLGHLAGWECIHEREGPWNADTGNGYHGGLQMSYGWAGRVTDAALLSPAAQIAAAEAEAAEHGWAYGWMAGQWPNTFPPCAGYF